MLCSWWPNQLIMKPLNGLTYFSAVFTVLTVFTGPAASEECGQEELNACARPLQVLTETSELSFVTKKSELDKLCPDLHAGLHCIRSYTRRCMNLQQRSHFNKLYHGTGMVIHELCKEGPYQEDFLRHAPCMRVVKSEYDVCTKRYQTTMAKIQQPAPATLEQQQREYQQQREQQAQRYQNNAQWRNGTTAAAAGSGVNQTPAPAAPSDSELEQEEGIKAVCCSFKEYIACSEHTVRRRCGQEAAVFTRSFLDKISSSLMRMHCEGFLPIPGKCGEPHSGAGRTLPSSSASSTFLALLLSMVTALLVGIH